MFCPTKYKKCDVELRIDQLNFLLLFFFTIIRDNFFDVILSNEPKDLDFVSWKTFGNTNLSAKIVFCIFYVYKC